MMDIDELEQREQSLWERIEVTEGVVSDLRHAQSLLYSAERRNSSYGLGLDLPTVTNEQMYEAESHLESLEEQHADVDEELYHRREA
ncbi:hypothetical protein [Halorubellus litoreus]|uniref:Uncharacterized protein n=1 Tax=Halorubellus litoreus TaxID=755308 RepID=A0ABD5VLK0_9EURY